MFFSCFVYVVFMFVSCVSMIVSGFVYLPAGAWYYENVHFPQGSVYFFVEHRMQDRSFFIILFRCVFMFVFIIVSCSLMCFGRFLGGMLELFGCFLHAWKCKFLCNMSGFGAQSPSISFARFLMYFFTSLHVFHRLLIILHHWAVDGMWTVDDMSSVDDVC